PPRSRAGSLCCHMAAPGHASGLPNVGVSTVDGSEASRFRRRRTESRTSNKQKTKSSQQIIHEHPYIHLFHMQQTNHQSVLTPMPPSYLQPLSTQKMLKISP